MSTKTVVDLYANEYYLFCPYCNSRESGYIGDVRGEAFACENCGESYTIHREAEVDIL